MITICSIYLKPDNVIDPIQLNDLISQLPQPFLLIGDFNARNIYWHDTLTNSRGNQILDIILNNQLHILDAESFTHYDQRCKTYSHIDLSVCTPDVACDFYWSTYPDRCGSDHYPVLIECLQFTANGSRKKWKYHNVDWAVFYKATSNIQSYDNLDCIETNLETFCKFILNTADKHIPFSCNIKIKCPVPWWNKECQEAKKARSKAYRKFKRSRSDPDYIAYKRQCGITKRTFKTAQRNSWKSYVFTINKDTPVSAIWKKVHKISGKNVQTHVPTLLVDNEVKYDPREAASVFAESLSTISRGSSSPSFLVLKRNQELNSIDFSTTDNSYYNKPFTSEELASSLFDCSNTAPGEDLISYEILKHAHESCLMFILELYDNILVKENFLNVWNTGIILPFLKPGKNPQDPKSYRPIALTSCLCKLLERMINSRLMWYLEHHNCLSTNQFGYRKLRSTLDPLTLLDTDIGRAFAENKYITAIFFDLEKAYDTTWRHLILKQLHYVGLRGHLPIAIQNFLHHRKFKVNVNGVLSDEHSQYEGVPQGSVLSTTLFILAVNNITQQLPPGVQCSLYVDDFAIWLIYTDVHVAENILQRALNSISSWTDKNGFTISIPKTVAITFTRKRVIPDLHLTLNNQPLKFVSHTKFLGMHFDQRMTWKYHIDHLREHCNKTLSLMKKLSHTKWGSDRSALLYLHQTLILSKIDYGSHLYASASKTMLAKLDPIHNTGLRLASGAFKSSPVVSLYADTGFWSLDHRRKEYSLNIYSQILRVSSKLSRLIENACIPARMGTRKFYSFAIRLKIYLDFYNLPPLKIIGHKKYTTPPWNMGRSNCCREMLSVNKSKLSPAVTKQLFLEHQEMHANSVSIFTDGFKSNIGVGCGIILEDRILHKKLPFYGSVYSAELTAISVALSKITSQPNREYTVYTDSQSALRAIDGFKSNHPLIIEIQERIHTLSLKNVIINICWIPGHVGLEGNEEADKAAKAAASNDHLIICKTYYKDVKTLFRATILTEWNQQWMNIQNNKLRSIKDTVMPWSSSIQKTRSHEVILSRLRIGHTRMTHKHLMENDNPPICDICHVRISVQHILISCSKYDLLRRQHFGLHPVLETILGDKIDIQRLLIFLKGAKLFNLI